MGCMTKIRNRQLFIETRPVIRTSFANPFQKGSEGKQKSNLLMQISLYGGVGS